MLNEQLRARYLALMSGSQAASTQDQAELSERVGLADKLRRAGRPDWAMDVLEPRLRAGRADARFQAVLALSSYALQDLERAFEAAARAADLAPDNADMAFMRAQFAFESWRPAVGFFRRARKLQPDNLDLTKTMAAALEAEGKTGKAVALLTDVLDAKPGWVGGHAKLASLLITAGADQFDESFAAACDREPKNLGLRLGWFHLLAQAKDWSRAKGVIDDARRVFSDQLGVRRAQVFMRAEMGETLAQTDLVGAIAEPSDAGFDLCRVRYLLRAGEVAKAEAIASAYVKTPHARLFWPYLSLCWRLLEDSRFAWLENTDALATSVDLALSEAELAELATVLRALHTMQQPYLEQSVRGGTQTSRNLFFNPHPRIQAVRRLVTQVIEDYRGRLTIDANHPLLASPPQRITYAGSWSVLLKGQGFHAAHTHILGWLSSALYVELPSAIGRPPAGHLNLGCAPPELGLDCGPLKRIAPKPGRLALFPSTTWHGTEPFDDGERLTIAFDVAP